LNKNRVNDVRQMETYLAEPLVTKASPTDIGIAIEKLKIYKSLGTNQILTGPIQAGGKILYSEIHNFINSLCNGE
jgi:hypothetical protein